ncbi:sulfite reductase (NADPH) [Sporocytophaga myxococcoides]|uniref:Sulfite reductase (NADPH) n=1 Tax=Sporocytophaga myxococcoides TaxID=153721 RepID=A0A098LJA6_9BACT|nr:nitrite reductase [Sporocytophaga myxococcoides]GAL86472.1 sulfite reductase (NADPH) [Sporocytophaga myxococcoides]
MSTELKVNKELLDKINPEAKEDILELQTKIQAFRNLELDHDKFRAFRLARGVYGQRQEGVQMVRIKLPFGKVSPLQLVRIADISDRYAAHNLHLTTRQDIQIHFVKLENAPKVWAELEEVGVTLREACGNTVRNITASSEAGIDPEELFDVTPYAHAAFKFFLRNPVCQEMGRKFKISFSSSEKDTAFGFMHDLGFIPRVKTENGKEVRGFKVFLGGGLGAQPFLAHVAYEFLPEDQMIPLIETVIRVFDRHGERSKRHKARLKYLVNGIGFEAFMKLVEGEKKAIKCKSFIVDRDAVETSIPGPERTYSTTAPSDPQKYENWLKTNVFEQKQKGFYGVNVKQFLGDMATDTAREFAAIVQKYASDDIRITVNQGWLLKYVRKEALTGLFNELDKLGLADPGFDSTVDITACPGTDTCNLAISSSTGISGELERMMKEEFPDLIFNKNIKIKISGCMNACGQHTIANIGFHGMSIKNGNYVLPAMQLLLGGGVEPDGSGSIADKVVKLPTKRCPDAVRLILADYDEFAFEGEYFNDYYRRQIAADKTYFYKKLKPLAELSTLSELDYIDWGHTEKYVTEVGVGECAGVMLDLVGTLINETEDKLKWAKRAYDKDAFADSIYQSYATFICGAKALLTSENINCNTHIGIVKDFDTHFIAKGQLEVDGGSFEKLVLKMSEHEPTQEFAKVYLEEVTDFLTKVRAYRAQKLLVNG